ncbi:hypothetical protein [Flavobacterium sp. A45]|uniref:hypothetical protein n=1 Tax=Flavobacterium sp. A45 TaxID=1945862 RepID=UPI0009879FAC|nr:hypothetical protein [Flavobacterium sp. A45]OOG65789.1 hypothetical protein B0E44_15485 [Flavobacterium sp. A45]
MRLTIILQLVSFLICLTTSAQKQEIKLAFEEFHDGYPQKALSLISDLDYKILNATDEQKADYFYIKGICYHRIADSQKDDNVGLVRAVEAFNDLLATENLTQIFKYSAEAKSTIYGIKRKLVEEATVLYAQKKFTESGSKFYGLYQIDKNDLSNLYYAALSFMGAKEYITALKYYKVLKKANYSGKVFYYAVDKSTGVVDQFESKADRDKALVYDSHVKLSLEMSEPKKENILKSIIVLDLLLNDAQNAKKAMLEFKASEPYNKIFDLAELKLYYETRDYLAFEQILLDRVEKTPNDADLYFCLGSVSEKLNKKKNIKKYISKVVEIDPFYQFENDGSLTSSQEAQKIYQNWIRSN